MAALAYVDDDVVALDESSSHRPWLLAVVIRTFDLSRSARSANDLQYGAAMIGNGVSAVVSWRLPQAVEEAG